MINLICHNEFIDILYSMQTYQGLFYTIIILLTNLSSYINNNYNIKIRRGIILSLYFRFNQEDKRIEQAHMKQNKQCSIDEKLIIASGQHNFQQVKTLIEGGANPQYIHYTGVSKTYKGNTSTALYRAGTGQIKNEADFTNVIELLLEKGADPKFMAIGQGPWGQHIQSPIFYDLSRTVRSFKDQKQKIRFLKILIKYKVDINKQSKSQRAGDGFGFRRTTCLLFEMLNQCRIKDKMYELSLLIEIVDFSKLRNQHQNYLRKSYAEKTSIQMPHIQYKKWWPNPEKQPPNKEFIKQLIELGANPNSSRTQYEWQNSQQEVGMCIPQLDITQTNNYQTALHRCIMNNQTQLVKILIEKGADVTKKCRVSIKKPLYPHEWPNKLRLRKQKENSQKLKEYEKQKINLTKRIQLTENQLEKYKLLKILRTEVEYKIFSFMRYCLENECPVEKCQKRQISCLELAQIFNVDEQMTRLLKQKINQQKV